MKLIYKIPKFYDFLDNIVSLGASNKAREYALKDLGGKILEIGIGTGKSSYYINKRELFGVDISRPMLERYKEKSDSSRIVLAEAQHIPFKNQSFDWTIFLFSLPSENTKKALQEGMRTGKKVLILQYKPMSRISEWLGKRVFDSPPPRLEKVLENLDYSRERYKNKFDIYRINPIT
jgi:ubiquinone/menaquinone biosynthesis C-methylase UbiE